MPSSAPIPNRTQTEQVATDIESAINALVTALRPNAGCPDKLLCLKEVEQHILAAQKRIGAVPGAWSPPTARAI